MSNKDKEFQISVLKKERKKKSPCHLHLCSCACFWISYIYTVLPDYLQNQKVCEHNSKKWSTSPGLHVQCVFWPIYKFYLDKNDKNIANLSQELGPQYRAFENYLRRTALLLNGPISHQVWILLLKYKTCAAIKSREQYPL